MKSEKYEGYNYIWHGEFEKNWYPYFHRIGGPAFIRYKSKEKERIDYTRYYLYNKTFFPWWTR